MFVDHDDADRILRTLPGLDGPAANDLSELLDRVDPVVDGAAAELARSVAGPLDGGPFAGAAVNASLDPVATQVLAVLAAVELNPRRQQLVMYIQDSVQLPRPTLHTIGRLAGPAAPAALGPGGALVAARYASLTGDGPWATRMAALDDRIAWHLAGHNAPDPGLPARPTTLGASGGGAADLLLVPGGDRASRHRTASAELRGARFVVCSLPADDAGWDAVVREATVTGSGVIVDLDELSAPAAARIEAANHLAWALCSPSELPVESLPDRPWIERRPPADPAATAAPEKDATDRVGGHRLDREQRRLLGAAAAGLGGDVAAAVRRLARGHLERLALRVPPRRTWDDLIVHQEQLDQLRELSARYRHRHRVHEEWGFRAVPSAGLVAVFAGGSGTGKTLAAEVIAGDLGLDLYKIDLAAVVSKYIGETEKNLDRIFGAASAGNVVLFFDEADALFGKRSEVGDAHDRYANIEVSYLLQRIETYDGLVVLATNLQRNMDQAFLRRIHVAVEFPQPDEEARRAIWALSFPPAAPAHQLDLDFLARQFKLSGGSIRNAAVGAAFLAAGAGEPITMELVALALKRELHKLGRLLTEDEFDRYFPLVVESAATPSPASGPGSIPSPASSQDAPADRSPVAS
jgi:hypothetical protein